MPFFCLFSAISLLKSAIVGFMGRFYVIFCVILGVVFLHEKLTAFEWFLIFMSILGGFLLNFKDSTSQHSLGMFLILAQTFLFAVVNMLIKAKLSLFESNDIVFYNTILILFLYIVLIPFLSNAFSMESFHIQGLLAIMISAFLSNVMGVLLFYRVLKLIKFSDANLIRLLGPIMIVLFFPLVFSKVNILGVILILCSMVMLGALKFPQVGSFFSFLKLEKNFWLQTSFVLFLIFSFIILEKQSFLKEKWMSSVVFEWDVPYRVKESIFMYQ